MKKNLKYYTICRVVAITIALLGAFSTPDIKAQSNIQVMANPSTAKMIAETTAYSENGNSVRYAYTEFAHLGGNASNDYGYGYSQIFWEQKFWKAPIFIHAEERTFLSDGKFDNTLFAGLCYSLYTPHGFIGVEPLYRTDNLSLSSMQLSLVCGFDFHLLDIANFNDLWYNSTTKTNFYSETRIYIKASKIAELGTILTLSYAKGEKPSFAEFWGVKLNL